MRIATLGLHPPFVHFVARSIIPLRVGPPTRSCTAMKWVSPQPQGSSLVTGLWCPGRHHLIDPIRPTRGHTAISPQSGLYAMPSLCGSAEATHARFRAFAACSFLTCRPLRPRGARTSYCPISRCRHGLRHRLTGSTLPRLPQSDPRGRSISWLHWFTIATACQIARLPLSDQTRIAPSHRRLLLPGFRPDRLPSPPLDITTTSTGLLCRRDLHPLEQQLASLH
jgi:hypothetical protein